MPIGTEECKTAIISYLRENTDLLIKAKMNPTLEWSLKMAEDFSGPNDPNVLNFKKTLDLAKKNTVITMVKYVFDVSAWKRKSKSKVNGNNVREFECTGQFHILNAHTIDDGKSVINIQIDEGGVE
jgi:hypothetical protein